MKAARPTSSDGPPRRTPRTRTVPQTIELEAIKDPEAEKPRASTEKVEGDASETPHVTDMKATGKRFDMRMAISGLVGAGVGAGVLALMVYTMPVIDVPQLERMVAASSERVQASENDAQLLKAEIKAVKEEAKRQADVLSALPKQMIIDPAVSDRLKAVEAVLQDLQAKVPSTARAPGKAAALLAGALLLRESLGSGKPLTLDIAVLKAAGVDAARLAALEPFASSGIATLDELIEQLGTFALPVAAVTPPKDAGAMTLTERLLESLAKLVTISDLEPKAPRPEERFPALVAALAAGDSAGAMVAFKTLPLADQQHMERWAKNLNARIETETLVADLMKEAAVHLSEEAGAP